MRLLDIYFYIGIAREEFEDKLRRITPNWNYTEKYSMPTLTDVHYEATRKELTSNSEI